jgi:FtsP/CotA-like multicopper oxidase with cupredoxin domain
MAAGVVGAGAASVLPAWLTSTAEAQQAAQVPLDPSEVPKFAHQLPIPRVFAPTVVRDSNGRVVRHEYTIASNVLRAQVLPPGFPQTTLLGYGGRVLIPGSSQTETVITSPGPVIDNTRGIPNRLRWRNDLTVPQFLPVDPVVNWANPHAMEEPEAPFRAFPPGYADAQVPIAQVTHTHGLVVAPHFDGTHEEWFTAFGHQGASYVSNVYEQPNEQPSTQLFFHDHAKGITRLNVYAGIVGPAYFIRDPNSPLDRADSPLPRGRFEIPLLVATRSFFTDGELDFPRVGRSPFFPYMEAEDLSQVVIVNGKAYPNLNVQRRQYRFRTLAASNVRFFQFQFQLGGLNGEFLPFTIIGSDGGYLPAPRVVDRVTLGITERADILFDFSRFAPGTQIIMRNTMAVDEEDPANAQVMRFTVVDSERVSPPTLSPALFPALARLVPDAPKRTKALVRFRDLFEDEDTGEELGQVTRTDRTRTIDGLGLSSPPTELPLIGSTELWELVNTNEAETDEPDFGFHNIHIHLLEFQVLNRQEIDFERYLQDWFLFNGRRPVTRPIVLDTNNYLIGDPIPPDPVETGWKDTAQARPQMVTRLLLRWAPQELPTGGATPGRNQYPMDVAFPTDEDPVTGPGYVWHCHMLSHEDHEMLRPLATVFAWRAGVAYPAGRVVTHNNINYRVRVAHNSSFFQPPPERFDLWERVNNNNGSWQPQIIYAVEDRVLHNGRLFEALHVHQARSGQTPPSRPDLWAELPTTAKGQLVKFCDPNDPEQAPFFAIGQNGTEEEALEVLQAALAVCRPIDAMPSAGITENATSFEVPDGSQFQPAPRSGTVFYETRSKLLNISVPQLGSGQRVIVNGRPMRSGTNYPLPPERNNGYIIEVTGGATFTAR